MKKSKINNKPAGRRQKKKSRRRAENIRALILQAATLIPCLIRLALYCQRTKGAPLRYAEILSHCDELDLKILAGLIRNARYADLSENLYISENTLKCRIKKLLSFSGGMSRKSLMTLAKKYINNMNP